MAGASQAGDFVPVEHDTFLDIVTNVVGILVILVILVAMQARDTPLPTQKASAAVATASSTVNGLARDVTRLRAAGGELAATLAQHEAERQYIATLKAAAEQALTDHRNTLGEAKDEFDLRRRRAAAAETVDELDRQRIQLAAAADNKVVEVKSYPTPLGKTVFGREVHFQIRGGRVAYLPIEELFEDAKAEARQKVWKLDGLPEATEMVGPRQGFRLRYTMEKVDIPISEKMASGQGGYLIRAKRWELIPTDGNLGEPVPEALSPGSQMEQVLSRLDRRETTITLWTYPDGFEDFRKLKAELYRRGFATAGRPLPEGISIGGSPHGTRSRPE